MARTEKTRAGETHRKAARVQPGLRVRLWDHLADATNTWDNNKSPRLQGWGLRSCPRCGRAARLRRAVLRCCAECSKLGPGGGTRVADRRVGGASARPQGLYRGAPIQAVATLLEPKHAKRSEKSASSHRRPALPAPQGGTFAHAATCEVPVEQRVRVGGGEVESAAALAAE